MSLIKVKKPRKLLRWIGIVSAILFAVGAYIIEKNQYYLEIIHECCHLKRMLVIKLTPNIPNRTERLKMERERINILRQNLLFRRAANSLVKSQQFNDLDKNSYIQKYESSDFATKLEQAANFNLFLFGTTLCRLNLEVLIILLRNSDYFENKIKQVYANEILDARNLTNATKSIYD